MRYAIRTEDQLKSLFRQLRDKLPLWGTIEVKADKWRPPKTRDQENKFNAMLRDVARSGLQWGGAERSFDEWRVLIKSAIQYAEGRPADVLRGIEGEVVSLPSSCAHWKKQDYMNAIEYLYAFGIENGVEFRDDPDPR